MAKEQGVTLTREEAQLVADALCEYLGRDKGLKTDLAKERAIGFRLQVKLSRATDYVFGIWAPDDWQLEILQRTFAPTPRPAPAKKPTPKDRAPRTKVPAKPQGRRGGTVARSDRAQGPSPVRPAHHLPTATQLTASAARRKGGLRRALQQAEARGDSLASTSLRKRIADIEESAAAVAAHA